MTAFSSDLVASFIMKPIWAGLHLRRRTVRCDHILCLPRTTMPLALASSSVLRAVDRADTDARAVQRLRVRRQCLPVGFHTSPTFRLVLHVGNGLRLPRVCVYCFFSVCFGPQFHLFFFF